MVPLHRIASKMFGQPLLITSGMAEVVSSVLLSQARSGRGNSETDADRMTHERPRENADGTVETVKPRASRFTGKPEMLQQLSGETVLSPFAVTQQGVAVITVSGETVNRGAWIGASSGLVSYEGVQHQLEVAKNSDRIKAVLIDIDSPGGEATGAFETADAIRELAAIKPVFAVANGLAASAGYALASGASQIWVSPSGHVGSIGVVALHLDYSEALRDEGIKPTLIFAGATKIDGNPYQPLPDAVKNDIQARLETTYAMFCAGVAAGRGNRLTAAQARATEAKVFQGRDAVAAGLADRVGTFRQALAAITKQISQQSKTTQGKPMSNDNLGTDQPIETASAEENKPALAAAPVAPVLNAEQSDALANSRAAGHSEALANAAAVLALPEAKGKTKLAQALALQGISPAAAAPLLAASPSETPGLSERMAADPVPALGNVGQEPKPQASIDRSTLYSRATRGG